jgi:diamine N-acetyltransferase
MDSPATPRVAPLVLQEVTRANYRDALKLKVAPGQEQFVAPNAVSIAQAKFHPEAWYRLIVAGATPVGFAMLEDWTQCPGEAPEDWRAEPYIGLWRFMIDARFQSTGYGAQALSLLIAHARTRAPARVMLLSFVEAQGGPEPFYSRFGFVRTGEIVEGEHVMRLDLAAAPAVSPR